MKSKSNIFLDILTLSSVPIISQFIAFFTTPLITRLFEPESFGEMSFYASISAFLGVFSTMGYHSAIILPKKNSNALRLVNLCLVINVFLSIIFFGAIKLFNEQIHSLFNENNLKYYFFLLPVSFFLHGFYQTLRFWTTRNQNFKTLSISRVLQTFSSKSFALAFGFLGYASGITLIGVDLITNFLKSIPLIFQKYSFKKEKLRIYLNFKSLIFISKKYKKFPSYNVINELLSKSPAIITVFLITFFFNKTLLGHYSFCISILALPQLFLISSIMEATGPRLANARHRGGFNELLLKINNKLHSIVVLPFLILIIFGEAMFTLFFGENWSSAGIVFQILACRSLTECLFTPGFSIINIIQYQELNTIKRIFNILIIGFSFILGGVLNNFLISLGSLVLLEGILYLGINFYILKKIKLSKKLFFRSILDFSFLNILTVFLLVILKLFIASTFLLLTLLFVVFVLYYYYIVYKDDDLYVMLNDMILKLKKSLQSNEK